MDFSRKHYKTTGVFRGQAFIEFETKEGAEKAIEMTGKVEYDGAPLEFQWKKNFIQEKV